MQAVDTKADQLQRGEVPNGRCGTNSIAGRCTQVVARVQRPLNSNVVESGVTNILVNFTTTTRAIAAEFFSHVTGVSVGVQEVAPT